MKQTNVRKLTPSPSSAKKSKAVVDKGASQVFISMVLDMSWRLALVVLIPVIGGVELDKHYHPAANLYFILGLVLAVGGAVIVVYRTYKLANEIVAKQFKGAKNAR